MTEEEVARRPTRGRLPSEVRSLQEKLQTHSHTLSKWGRMLNALLDLLAEKGIASKDEVMMKAYELLQDLGALERSEESGEPT